MMGLVYEILVYIFRPRDVCVNSCHGCAYCLQSYVATADCSALTPGSGYNNCVHHLLCSPSMICHRCIHPSQTQWGPACIPLHISLDCTDACAHMQTWSTALVRRWLQLITGQCTEYGTHVLL